MYAVRAVLNHNLPSPPPQWVSEDTRVAARVKIGEELYEVEALPDESGRFRLNCGGGGEVTAEYIYLTSHCDEMDTSEVFSVEAEEVLPLFLKYASEDSYYLPRELSRLTFGMSDLKSFRNYLRRFIDDFVPERIRDGKEYEMILEKRIKYGVRCLVDSVAPPCLSETENILFRYLCFLKNVDFWRGFERLRNIHGVDKPLLIDGLTERLDMSVDPLPLLHRAEQNRRQVIVLTRV